MEYKDKTFCPFSDCKVKKCKDRYTDKIASEAAAFGLPCSLYAEKPPCYVSDSNSVAAGTSKQANKAINK